MITSETDQETLTKLHSVMLELLDEFVSICEENNLVYFLIAGTLLGAVRHKGFIPWDDDMDVAMPRDDYERFLDITKNGNKLKFYVLSNRSPVGTRFHYKPFAKFCKKGTLFAEDYITDPRNCSGIWLDIWPFDNCRPFFLPIQTYTISVLRRIYRLKTQYNTPVCPKTLRKNIGRILFWFFPLALIKKSIKKAYTFFNQKDRKHISFLSGICGYKKETHKYKTIFPLKKIAFEGKYYNTPGNWDAFLTQFYGNYMELPPIEKRKTHMPKYIQFNDADVYIEKLVSSKHKDVYTQNVP